MSLTSKKTALKLLLFYDLSAIGCLAEKAVEAAQVFERPLLFYCCLRKQGKL
ncbi:MAG: hypothetical protein RLN82_03845 [Pseudomonadales bacterium]